MKKKEEFKEAAIRLAPLAEERGWRIERHLTQKYGDHLTLIEKRQSHYRKVFINIPTCEKFLMDSNSSLRI